jgi:hypothetical protein
MSATLALVCGTLLFAGPSPVTSTQVQGDYVEARTADIYTGPCFSNAEVFITGSSAVAGWKINRGTWNGVDLSGLCVAAALQASTTLSEDQPELARSVVIVDKNANAEQRAALVALARELAGKRLNRIAAVVPARLMLTVESQSMADSEAMSSGHQEHGMPKAPKAVFWAAGIAEILTRPLDEGDHACGNEVVAYPPVSKGVDALPAYTLGHKFQGKGLGTTWNDPNCRSSFVGHFAL